MDDAESQRDWVTQVLGVSFSARADVRAASAGAWKPILPLWAAAKDAVDTSIDKLQRALLDDGDDYLRTIAEFGLNGATNRQSVRLMAALRDADATPSEETRSNATDAVEAFRDFLQAAPIVSLIEDNPFGIAVPLRSTLGKALDDIAHALAA
jgi:hypothetical protein